nr:dynein axonemal heavy chain 2 isoform X1 [Parasteatoda tepidariorum]XP_042907240.1 dynein axonemal heavy chain 2 isoform X1 [Parasteatoda tepidariorum]
MNLKGPFHMDCNYEDAMDHISSYIKTLHYLQEREHQMKHDAPFFNIDLKPLDTLEIVEIEIECLKTSWLYVTQYQNFLNDWTDITIMNFNVMEKQKCTDELQADINVLRAEKGFHYKLLDELSLCLNDLNDCYKVVTDFQEPTFQARHWNMLRNILNLDLDDCEKFFKSQKFTFQFLRNFDLSSISYEVNMITLRARKEHEIEQTLNFARKTWENIYFSLNLYGNNYKLDDSGDIVDIVENQLTTLGVLKTSKYVLYFSDQVDDLDNSLRLILDSIELMESFQKRFFPLEVIFSVQVGQAELSKESPQFQEVITLWADVSNVIKSVKLAWQTCHEEGFVDRLYELNRKIEDIQQSLNFYLDSKRRVFPRFYFISNDDLLTIIGLQKSTAIQPYLKKLFDSLHRLEIMEKTEEKMREKIVTNQALGMYSSCNESVQFSNPINLEGPVESWLLEIEKMMHSALKTSLSKCLQALSTALSKEEYDFGTSKWLTKFPGQVCLLAIMIQWTAEVTQGIKTVQETAVTSALKALKKKWRNILYQLSKRLRKPETKPLLQKKIMNLILSIVHSCDVIESLMKYVCNNVAAFEWIVHLRFYMNYDKNTCMIRQTNSTFSYGFEYLGNTDRLVITPNTDRCFLSITTALNLHQGAFLKGCKNSGKTETLKEVGKAFGNYVLIMNCSENMTHFSLMRMLSGLAQIGAWGLFERFNLLKTEIISVLSQEVSSIFNSQARKESYFSFMGNKTPLNNRCGIFLSFDSGSNFSIPFGLSDVFRPASIISPDCKLIIEVYLFSYGFQEAKALAADVDLVFKKMREQLSRKLHYSFGLRAIMHFLKYLKEKKKLDSHLSEDEFIVSSLRETTVQILDSFDIPIFESILEIVFGFFKSDHDSKLELCNDIKKVLEENFLQPDSSTIETIKYLYELRKYYHSIILLGESGSGKTTTWKMLKELEAQYNRTEDSKLSAVHSFIFNAKAFTLKELFGFFPENEIWSDGLFSATLRKACLNERAKESWLILNGPLDKEWIGNISSLLDANKVFTLANGERIVLANMVTLIFETTNILHCSPSILSCMGIVYHKSSNVVWKNFLFSWIHKCENENLIPVVKKLIEEYMENILEFAFDSLRSLKSLSITKLNCVSSFSCLMDIYVKNVSPQKVDSTIISRIFWLSIIWSIGAAISEDEKNEFDAFIKSLNDSLNALESVYNYHLDANFEWIKWSSYLPEKWQPPMNSPFENWFIPTARCISYQHFILQFTNTLHPVLLIGNSRCGKTALVEDLFSVLDRDTYTHNIVNILPQISSNKFQTVIESQLEKKAGGIMLPHFKRKLINFLDNIDNIICDESGSQPPLELLLMAIDCGFWYDRKTWTKNCLRNVSYVASSSSFGSANKIPDPLLNRFCVFNVPELKDEMKNIFLTLMKQKIPSVSLETQRLLNSLSSGTVKAYELIRENFLPTPTKLHYLFHLRSVKKVLFNLLNINTEYLDNRISITKFWFHEFTREFSDLLINDDDRLLMFRVLAGVVEKEFLIPVARVCAENEPVFVKFLTPDTGYNEIQDISILQKLLETYIESYKHKKLKDLQIVLFKQYLDHFVRILRAIENPHGNVILLGASGTGRRTLCKIGAFVLNYEVFEITFDEDFDEQSFKEALQKLLRQIGINGKDVLFIISDYQISDDFYLEFLSDIVAIGVPPDLFSSLELKEIYSEMEKSMIVPKGGNDFFKHFASNIKSHFHLAFCVSYTSSHYKRSILKYPDLYKHSTVDWFEEWPVEALETISEKFLLDLQEPPIDQKVLQTYSVILCDMHLDTLRLAETEKSENNVFETSSSFVKLVNAFKRLLVNKQEKVQYSLNRLISGLQKINETQDKVNEIAKQTKEAHEKLVIATRECDAALIDIKAKREIVEQKQKIIEEKKIEIERKEKVCKKIELAAQEDLNAALPALEEARKALEALNKRDIGEIKSYAKPPELVALVLQAVMILRDSEPSWAEAKRQLGSPNFLKQLMEFDRDNIPDDALDDLEKIIKKKEFKPEKVGKVSFAAKSLCLWVKAMYMYGRIYKKVKPKVERLRLVQEELSKLQKTLSDLFAELNALHEAIAQLEHEHDLLMKTKEEYARKEKELALKLARAESIMESLRSEKERWQLKVATLQEKKDYVIGDSFLASGYLTYLGPYDQYFRSNISTKWKTKISSKFAFNQEFSLAEFFVEEDVLNDWIMCGLPSDQYSFEGAAIVNENLCWSFLVDPEGHAAKWIKNLSVKNKLKYIDYQDPKYLSLLELAISEGFPVLIENMNPKLNLIINSLLKLSKNQNICFNGKEMKMNPNFRLFMSTKLSNPDFSSFAIKELFIVNFTIKQKGLEDQLLPIIVRNERPDLELIKEKLVKGIIDCKKRFTAVEDKILKLLSKAEGSLLEDEVLVHALQECKSESNEVEMELTSNQKTEVRIDQARDEYRPCAKLASILYFVLADMNKVNLIYMFALDSYLDLFLNSIQKSQKDPEVSGRIKKVNLFHQYSVYRYACRCVLNKHALLFLFHMCTQILLADHKLGIDEYEFFIHGGKESGEKNKLMNPCSHWLSEESWNQIIQLELLPKFLGITVSFDEAPKLWYEWYSSQEPENKLLPGNWRNICSEFEKLLLIRCLRPDRIINCISNLIANNLGRNFLAYPEIDIREIFEESSAKKPLILFTVSSDAHAEQIISNHAHERNTKYRVLSLAERQGNLASQLIVDSIKVGDWAFISNAHLLQPWLPTLEKIVSILQTVKAHPNFRLWLSSSPIDSFPSSILLNSIVLSLDSPKGIQANMLDLYHKYGSNAGSDFTSLELRFKSLLYSLGFFHSILLCRKRFQNLGWNGTYEFSYSDFKVSSDLLQLYLEEYREDPWDALQEMIAEIIYGGHFTNRRDKELMLDYYNQYISDDVSEKYILAPVENYAVPDDGPIQLYLESIRKLPTRDVPEVFGQHKNAEIPCQMYDSERLLKDMEKIRRQKILEVNIKPEVLFIITKIKEEIPDFLNINAAMKLLKRKPEPYTYVLIQEVRQYNSLLKVVSESLQNLKDVIIGKQMMTEAFYAQVLSIQRMEVPSEWMKIYPSLKPLESWIADLRERIKFFANWISAKNLPVKVWLPAFTNPVSFLNAALLTAAKNSDMMIKDLMWEHQVSTLDEKYIFEAPQEGIYIRGLYLEGAGWDRTNSLLTDPEPLKLITSLPVVHFKPVIESSIRGIYNCPCYYTSKRTDEEGNSLELFSIDLKTKKGKGHWRKRGACLLLCDST